MSRRKKPTMPRSPTSSIAVAISSSQKELPVSQKTVVPLATISIDESNAPR